jgi:hypothetical protein
LTPGIDAPGRPLLDAEEEGAGAQQDCAIGSLPIAPELPTAMG